MENLTAIQAQILAKAISEEWDNLPSSEEVEYGPNTEKKANAAILNALQSAEVVDAGIKLNGDALTDLIGQFQVYLESAENLADLTRMEDELAALFAAE